MNCNALSFRNSDNLQLRTMQQMEKQRWIRKKSGLAVPASTEKSSPVLPVSKGRTKSVIRSAESPEIRRCGCAAAKKAAK